MRNDQVVAISLSLQQLAQEVDDFLALRAMLGIGRFDPLSDEQLSEAKWIDALLAKAARETR